MARFLSDVIDIMRLAIGRRNKNDKDSTDIFLTKYVNNFISLSMTDDVHIFQNFETLVFNIDETREGAVYPFKEVSSGKKFSTISSEGFISRAQPPGNEFSWNRLYIYFDPGIFFDNGALIITKFWLKGIRRRCFFMGQI